MNNELKFDLKRLKLYYYTFRYSPYYSVFVPSASFIVFVLILWLFFIPEVQSWFSLQNEVEATKERIRTAKSNYQYLELLGDTIVENDFKAAATALPPEKDFAAILSVISEAADKARIQVDDFSFILGDVSNSQQTPSQTGQEQVPIAPGKTNDPVAVAFGVNGSPDAINSFIKEIEANVPLSELRALDFVEGKAQVRLDFYVRAFPSVVYTDTAPIDSLTTEEKNLLLQLRGWQ